MEKAKEYFKQINEEKDNLAEARAKEEQTNMHLLRSLDQYKKELERLRVLTNKPLGTHQPQAADNDVDGVPRFLLS